MKAPTHLEQTLAYKLHELKHDRTTCRESLTRQDLHRADTVALVKQLDTEIDGLEGILIREFGRVWVASSEGFEIQATAE